MSKNDDGGPAFPLKNYTSEIGPDNCGFMAKDNAGHELWVNSGSPGMSLRDWFAGRALSGILRDQIVGVNREYDTKQLAPGVSEAVYQIADAMLVERDKNKD